MRAFLLFLLCWPVAVQAVDGAEYRSPDGALVALVQAVPGRPFGRGENRVVIMRTGGKVLSTRGYASRDGAHGYGVERAAWTPDSKFFVYSMSSSGGHQAWRFPTFFYARADRRTRRLDDFIGTVTAPDFALSAPDIVSTVGTPGVVARSTSLGRLLAKGGRGRR